MRLDALARWLQDVAFADVEDAGLAQSAVWVVRRTRLRVRRFPRFGERFQLATFCSGLGRMWAERRTTVIREGEPKPPERASEGRHGDVEAVSLWVHLDPADWRPVPIAEREIATYGDSAGGRRVTARLRHPGPDSRPGQAFRWTFRATECDIAGHVNNAAYWQPLEEELLCRERALDSELLDDRNRVNFDAEIEYRAPAQPGEKLVLRDGEWRWIVSVEGETHASIVVRDAAIELPSRNG